MESSVGARLLLSENGEQRVISLDDRRAWEIGRPGGKNRPDISLYSATVSRRHGRLQNMDGIWFYLDHHSKNGTVYNGKKLQARSGGKLWPILLSDGDILEFGGKKGAWCRINFVQSGERGTAIP